MRRLLEERFWEKVDKSDSPDACWIWKGSTIRGGYGEIFLAGRRKIPAHSAAYLIVYGVLPPKGYVLDHLCRNPPCVNLAHLELVTHAENIRRGYADRGRPTHCPQGHVYDPQRVADGRPLYCRICMAERAHNLTPEQREARRKSSREWAQRKRQEVGGWSRTVRCT